MCESVKCESIVPLRLRTMVWVTFPKKVDTVNLNNCTFFRDKKGKSETGNNLVQTSLKVRCNTVMPKS